MFFLRRLFRRGPNADAAEWGHKNVVPRWAEYKKNGVVFPHPVGIVIGSRVEIGAGTWIWQNVTIGAKKHQLGLSPDEEAKRYPTIGKNVMLYAGAVIVGPIHIGDGAAVGANSVVLGDVPAGATVAGNPAKIIRSQAQ
ncbi:MAG: hypothetical protein LBL46_00730 [Rickettsiales bacterium]|jgi:serine O-acetyltransferase|nr:hypothetical protein [Rickettsiales bacterium]